MSDFPRPEEGPSESRPGRDAYEKPQLRRIRLTAEEVLAKGCKSSAIGSGFQGPGCLPGGCFSNGS